MDKPLSDFYWTNIHDLSCPFGLMVEHTNFIPSSVYNNHIIYLSRYVPHSNQAQLNMSKEQIYTLYSAYLKKIFPKFNRCNVKGYHLFKGKYSNPLISLNYSKKIPPFETPIKGLFIVERSQLARLQQGTDNCVKLVRKFLNSTSF